MQLSIIAVGHRMPGWVDTAFDEYAARMPPELRMVLKEVRPEARTDGKTVDAMMATEADRIRAALPRHGVCVALDERGDDLDSIALSKRLAAWRADGDDVAFLIGGPDGLDPRLRREAQMRMRLSSMTLPHALARVVLAEQLYRAWTILQNHPYHRA